MDHLFHIRSVKRVLGSLLLALLAVVSNGAVPAALVTGPPECGMRCCRARKACCCRKAPGAKAAGAIALVARTCPPGCRQAAAAPAPMTPAGLAPAFAIAVPVPVSVVLAPAVVVICCGALLGFALFQRPPPPFLPSHSR